jgi:hypothetical protein
LFPQLLRILGIPFTAGETAGRTHDPVLVVAAAGADGAFSYYGEGFFDKWVEAGDKLEEEGICVD